MSRFPLPREFHWDGRPSQVARAIKRLAAEERNAQTPHRRTRAHREGRCGCQPGGAP